MTPVMRDILAMLFVIFRMSAILALAEASGCCPDGWISFRHSCYLFEDEQKMDWSEAVNFCRLKNGELVTIETEFENRFIKYFANKLFRQGSLQRNITAFWIGATDADREGIWKWITTDTELTYTGWNTDSCHSSNRPYVTPDNKADCVVLTGAFGFCWHDVFCTSRAGYAICEKIMTDADNIGMTIIG